MMTSTVIERKKDTHILGACKIYAALALIGHIFCIYKYFVGIFSAFGNSISIVSSIEMVFGILSMSGAYYRGICNALLGAAYLVLFALIIKNFVSGLSVFSKILKENRVTKNTKSTIALYGKYVGNSFFYVIVFSFASLMVSNYTLSNDVYAIMVIWGLLTLFNKTLCSFAENYTWQTALTKAIHDAIAIISVGLLLFLSKYPSLEELIYSLKTLLVLPKAALLSMIMPIIYGVLMIMALDMADSVYNGYHTSLRSQELIASAYKVLAVAASLGVGAIIINVWGGHASRLDIEKILTIFGPYFSIICASLAALVTFNIPLNYIHKNNPDEKNAHLYTVDNDGVLRINEGVTQIESFAFENRTDITEVFISESVESMGESVFAGCTKITKIHCASCEQPADWSAKWHEDCNTSIFWNCEATTTEDV